MHGALNGLNLEVSQCSLCILAFSLVFTPYLSNAVVSAKSPHYFLALVALKLLVSLISRLVACSARIVVDRQTDRQTHTHRLDTQNDYCNPRCACAPRVSNSHGEEQSRPGNRNDVQRIDYYRSLS